MRPWPAVVASEMPNPAGAFSHNSRAARASRESALPPVIPAHHRPRLGIAFSGGAARGLAHIGVIQVLEEHGFTCDVVSGSSMGAYIGALWCAGLDGYALEREAHAVSHWRVLAQLMDPVFPPRRGFVRGDQIRRRLCDTIHAATFEELRTPLLVTATNLDTLSGALFTTGDVAQAVLASCAIPGICEPVEIDGSRYTDGAVTEPVPVAPLLDRGVDAVIAVDVMPPPSFQRYLHEHERAEAAAARDSLVERLQQRLNYFARGNILDTLYRSLGAAQMILAETACAQADVVIRPLCCDASWYEFHRPEKYIALGRAAAVTQLPRLRALLAAKEVA